ncbi:NAD(P)-binding protein [Auricularia subglabra TFB-10046 SS5]|nr:NAD(P)-binding protein [Auricularia subglabra TFB-10046 SS5]
MGFLYDVREQLSHRPPVPVKDFTGKTVLVTGSNVGLGKEAVRHFIRLNAAHVIMGVRSLAKGEAARSELLATDSTHQTRISLWQLDMASYASVIAFAQLSLLPVLRRAPEPVLSVVCSNMHSYTSFPERKAHDLFAGLRDAKRARMLDRYSVSKLIQLFAFRELAARMDNGDVTINLLNPGLCKTELSRNADGAAAAAVRGLQAFMGWTAEEGGRTLVLAASAGKESHGQYFNAGVLKPKAVSAFVKSAEGGKLQKRIWDELSEKLEKIQPGIMATF